MELLEIAGTTNAGRVKCECKDFAGFGFRLQGLHLINSSATLRDDYNAPPSLIIETADATVPEPTTIFGSAIGLYLGGWLKRKKSSQQNKTKSSL